jgi:hypothetical protein
MEKLVAKAGKAGVWADKNRSKVVRIQYIAAAVAGALLIIFAYAVGHARFELILAGARTQGTVVAEIQQTTSAGYKSSSSSSRGIPTTVYRPVVEFDAGNRVVRFKDWLASPTRYPLGANVPVLYEAGHPEIAMIDREGAWNWMPWSPMFFLGLFLVLVSIKHWLKSNRAKPNGQLNELKPKLPGLRLPEPELPDADDTIACKVSWDPAKPGGANFIAQKMTVSGSQVVIERSGAAIRFYLFFVFLGLVVQGVGGLLIFRNSQLGVGVFMIVLGVLFDVVVALLLIGDKKITFDRSAGVYFRGKAFDHSNSSIRSQQGRLADIHAIQLVDEQIKSRSADRGLSTYTSYEMNLVFKDGGRLNVMDHGIEDNVEEAARQLGKFLSVPIWRKLASSGL